MKIIDNETMLKRSSGESHYRKIIFPLYRQLKKHIIRLDFYFSIDIVDGRFHYTILKGIL